jgi:nucleoside-diphosphate-sugar epimerase
MKALVTGGTGFLGRRLVRRLLRQGVALRCLVRPTSDLTKLREFVGSAGTDQLELIPCSLGRIDSFPEIAAGCDVVFHLAAAVTGSTAVLFMENVVGTRKLLDAVSQSPKPRFILVSSLGVYSTFHLRQGDWVDEKCPLDPKPHWRDAYTYSKIVQEQAVWEAHQKKKIELFVVRPGVIYGPGRDCITARVGLRFGDILVKMGGRQHLPYTFVENCADAIALAGELSGANGEAVNIVDDDPPRARDLLRQYQSSVKRLRVVPIPYPTIGPLSQLFEWYSRRSDGQLPAVLTRYKSMAQWKPLHYSNAKAKKMLGWTPRINFAEGMERTFASLRQAGAGI